MRSEEARQRGSEAATRTGRRRGWRRAIGLVVLCLVLGAAVNVLVAWGIVLWHPGILSTPDLALQRAIWARQPGRATNVEAASGQGNVLHLSGANWRDARMLAALPSKPAEFVKTSNRPEFVQATTNASLIDEMRSRYERSRRERYFDDLVDELIAQAAKDGRPDTPREDVLPLIETASVDHREFTVDAGWPLRSMQAHVHESIEVWHSRAGCGPLPRTPPELRDDDKHSAIVLPDTWLPRALHARSSAVAAAFFGSPYRPLPVLPIAKPFVINTVIYGGVLLAFISVLRWIRATRRHGVGLCPACGYDWRDLAACPECGRARQPARAAARTPPDDRPPSPLPPSAAPLP